MLNLARPYAQAAFEYATAHKQVDAWSEALQYLATVVKQPNVAKLLKNPKLTPKELVEICCSFIPTDNSAEQHIINFIKVLAENRRLNVIPEINELFAEQRAASEKVLQVEVDSVIELSEDYQKKLIKILTKKLGSEIKLKCVINKDLMGGLLIRAGDLVIDSSIRGQLERMKENLVNK